MSPRTLPRNFLLLALFGLLVLAGLRAGRSARAAGPEAFVWLEGEAVASISPDKLTVKRDGWGRKEFLSGEKWLHVSIDAGNVERYTPVEGVLLTYPFTTREAGRYEVW